MGDWLMFPLTAVVLTAFAWSGWRAHRDAWWLGSGFLVSWWVAVPVGIGALAGLWVIRYG